MGHTTFIERHNRPNYKLHVVIFLVIIGASIFLATQVEKSRDKVDIAALKNPVPIDFIENQGDMTIQLAKPVIQPPVIVKNSVSSPASGFAANPESEQEQEYDFDPASNVGNVNAVRIDQDSVANEAPDTNVALITNAVAGEHTNEPVQQLAAQIDPAKNINQPASLMSLEQVYQQQNDRFLETLAKSAAAAAMESTDIMKLQEAIHADKPLIEEKSSQANQNQIATTVQQDSIAPDANVHAVSLKMTSSMPMAIESEPQDAPQKANTIVMTKSELDNIVNQFANFYNAGDINRLMALFAENASTNDQPNKLGIMDDYAELFSSTRSRILMINQVNWQLGTGKAEGAAEFMVTVQAKNGAGENSYRGHILITAEKQPMGVYITRLLHQLQP